MDCAYWPGDSGYLADDDVWFRVGLNQDGALLTAFIDAQAMERLGRP